MFDKKYTDALRNLSKAMQDVADLCDGDEMGGKFNEYILFGKLGHVWGMSLDEGALEIQNVVCEMLDGTAVKPAEIIGKVSQSVRSLDGDETRLVIETGEKQILCSASGDVEKLVFEYIKDGGRLLCFYGDQIHDSLVAITKIELGKDCVDTCGCLKFLDDDDFLKS